MCEFVSKTWLNVSLLHFKERRFKALVELWSPQPFWVPQMHHVECVVLLQWKKVKTLDFKLFFKHFVFIKKGWFWYKKGAKKVHWCERLFGYQLIDSLLWLYLFRIYLVCTKGIDPETSHRYTNFGLLVSNCTILFHS